MRKHHASETQFLLIYTEVDYFGVCKFANSGDIGDIPSISNLTLLWLWGLDFALNFHVNVFSGGSLNSQKKDEFTWLMEKPIFCKLFNVSLFLKGSISWLCSSELQGWDWCLEMIQLVPRGRTSALSEDKRKPILENNFPTCVAQTLGQEM